MRLAFAYLPPGAISSYNFCTDVLYEILGWVIPDTKSYLTVSKSSKCQYRVVETTTKVEARPEYRVEVSVLYAADPQFDPQDHIWSSNHHKEWHLSNIGVTPAKSLPPPKDISLWLQVHTLIN